MTPARSLTRKCDASAFGSGALSLEAADPGARIRAATPSAAPVHQTTILLLAGVCLPALARADFDAGWAAYLRGDLHAALLELTPAADQDARAALALARIHLRGEGVPRDTHQALMWLRRAGDLGEREAQFELGNAYASGKDAPYDPREAAVWYRRAAEQGHAAAQFALGALLVRGEGFAPDASAGRAWIERAAAAGWPQARIWLGEPVKPLAAAPEGSPPAPAATPSAASPPPPSAPQPSIQWQWGIQYGWGGPYGGYWAWHYWGWYPWGWYPHSGVHIGVGVHN